MLWLVVLVQTLFFIVHNKHQFVILFILVSLGASYFTKNELYYLLLPVLFVHSLYLYTKQIEPFNSAIDRRLYEKLSTEELIVIIEKLMSIKDKCIKLVKECKSKGLNLEGGLEGTTADASSTEENDKNLQTNTSVKPSAPERTNPDIDLNLIK